MLIWSVRESQGNLQRITETLEALLASFPQALNAVAICALEIVIHLLPWMEFAVDILDYRRDVRGVLNATGTILEAGPSGEGTAQPPAVIHSGVCNSGHSRQKGSLHTDLHPLRSHLSPLLRVGEQLVTFRRAHTPCWHF